MRREVYWDKEQRVADLVVLLGVVCLALMTWSWLGHSGEVPLWKVYVAVLVTMFLSLAALTRHRYWARSLRLTTGVWIAAAPFSLGFSNFTPALWTYLAIGGLIAASSIPGLALFRSGQRSNALPQGVENILL